YRSSLTIRKKIGNFRLESFILLLVLSRSRASLAVFQTSQHVCQLFANLIVRKIHSSEVEGAVEDGLQSGLVRQLLGHGINSFLVFKSFPSLFVPLLYHGGSELSS